MKGAVLKMNKTDRAELSPGQGSVPQNAVAAAIEAEQKYVVKTIEPRMPKETQVLVKVEGCGVCSSNLPVWEGREWFSYPLEPGAPGHEGWGVVHRCGSGVHTVSPGDRVTFLSSHAFSTFDTVEEQNLVVLPAKLHGLPFPGEPLGCAVNVFERAEIRSGQTVGVVGAGFLGTIVSRLCHLAGARVIALSRRPFALGLAQQFGADHTVLMDDHYKAVEKVMSLTQNRGCDRVIEASGNQWFLDFASEITALRSKLIIAGYHQDGLRTVNMQQWNWKGVDVINAHERENSQYMKGIKTAVRLVAEGMIDFSPLLTHSFALESINEAFDMMRKRPEGFMKAMVIL